MHINMIAMRTRRNILRSASWHTHSLTLVVSITQSMGFITYLKTYYCGTLPLHTCMLPCNSKSTCIIPEKHYTIFMGYTSRMAYSGIFTHSLIWYQKILYSVHEIRYTGFVHMTMDIHSLQLSSVPTSCSFDWMKHSICKHPQSWDIW